MDADEHNRLIDRQNLKNAASRVEGSKVASTKVFSICPDCRDIITHDGAACQCSRHDNGRWYKRTGGWQYIPEIERLLAQGKEYERTGDVNSFFREAKE